jgi:hypothetical protein
MTVYCHTCGSRNLRPSRLQPKDLIYFLTLRYPVRCRYCRKRFSVSIFRIGMIRREADARIHREEYEEHRSRTANPGGRTSKDQH